MTELLYLPDNEYEKKFEAEVQAAADNYVVLDRTLFYKEGGGQPADHGTLFWEEEEAKVTDVQKEHGEIRHYIGTDTPEEGCKVEGRINWERRHDHMRMHTAQHVLSKVALDLYGAETQGNQIHRERSRIDFDIELSEERIRELEDETNRIIREDLTVEKKNMERKQAEKQTPQGRGLFELIPESVDPLRMVQIADFDLCPCGGTHVDSTGEVGGINVIETKSKGSGVDRLEFELT